MAFQTIQLVMVQFIPDISNPSAPTTSISELIYDAELELNQVVGITEWIHPVNNQVFPGYTNIIYGPGQVPLVSSIPYAIFKTMI